MMNACIKIVTKLQCLKFTKAEVLLLGLDTLCLFFCLLCYAPMLEKFTYYAHSEVHYAFFLTYYAQV